MYFGSVRFFKNLILLVLIILIAVPVVFALRLNDKLGQEEAENVRLEQALAEAQRQLFTGEPPAVSAAPLNSAAPVESAPVISEAPVESVAPETIYYQSLYPDFYAPESYHATERTVGTIYLTFDDGPSESTDRILAILAEQNVKATFFVTGESSEGNGQRLRDIVAQGHSLGMHSDTHNYGQIYQSVEAFLDDMYRVFTLIREETGETPTLFRFPGGSINSYNAGLYQELVAEMLRRGFVPYDWNMSGEDATSPQPSTAQIVQNVMRDAERMERGFVLLHDSTYKTNTVNALETIIRKLRDMGFEFDRITPETKPVWFVYTD